MLSALSVLVAGAEGGAQKHLEACAVAPRIERNGKRIDHNSLVSRLSLIGGLSAQAEEDQAARSRQEIWCVEEAIRDPQAPLLYWRNIVAPQGDTASDDILDLGPGGPVDRLSLMTVEEPPVWLVDADTGANMLIDKPGDGAPIIHALIRRESYLISMFAFFRGRPDLRTLTPLVRDIVLGKARPVATANSKTGAVTVPKKTPGN